MKGPTRLRADRKGHRRAGANVTLVSGPVSLTAPAGVKLLRVESAAQMHDAVMQAVANSDIFIGCAAVSDYRVDGEADHKIKKSTQSMSLQLLPTTDILAAVSALDSRPFCVGFAAETENLEDYARGKLEKKNLNMIIANLVGKNRGFDVDENAVEVFWSNGQQSFPLADKRQLSQDLVVLLAKHYLQSIDTDTPTELPAILVRD